MLYLIHGADTYRSRRKLNELLAIFGEQNVGAEIFRMSADDFDCARCEELVKSQSLFGGAHAVVIEGVLELKEPREFIVSFLPKIAESKNQFFFLENEIDDEDVAVVFKKHTAEIHETKNLTGAALKKWFDDKNISTQVRDRIIAEYGSDLWKAEKEIEKSEVMEGKEVADGELARNAGVGGFNIFAICDAVAAKDRKQAWVAVNKALMSGLTIEEIFYKVQWQIKNLLILKNLIAAKVADLAKATGWHPFVLKKTMAAAGKFTDEELSRHSFSLVKLFHDSRWGNEDMAIGLEKFLIGM